MSHGSEKLYTGQGLAVRYCDHPETCVKCLTIERDTLVDALRSLNGAVREYVYQRDLSDCPDTVKVPLEYANAVLGN